MSTTTNLYALDVLAVAASRGYDDDAHRAALAAAMSEADWDAIGLTHPANWLTEDEVEHGLGARMCATIDCSNRTNGTYCADCNGLVPDLGHDA